MTAFFNAKIERYEYIIATKQGWNFGPPITIQMLIKLCPLMCTVYAPQAPHWTACNSEWHRRGGSGDIAGPKSPTPVNP